MYFKSTCLALGVLVLSGLTAAADEALNTCNIEIEGATVLMSRNEIAAEWSSRGYVESPPPHRARSRPDPNKSLSFQTADGLPNDRFISSMGWADRTRPGLSDKHPPYFLSATYQPPADAAGLEIYKQFLRDEITSWCQWAAPILEWQLESFGREHSFQRHARLKCGQVLAGEFMTTQNGIPVGLRYPTVTPTWSPVIQTWNGCNWRISSDNHGRLAISITGPIDPSR